MDIISGSWPGEIFFFKGGPEHTFAAPEMIEDKDGNIINIGGGIQEQSNQILITGNAKFEQTKEGTFVYYRGRKIENTPEKPIGITGSASAVSVADWDNDGDLDLIVGTIGDKIYLIPNEGTPESLAFGKEREIACVSSQGGPCAADWDGDGDLDLLVGVSDGSVLLFTNTGDVNSPKLDSSVQLVPPGRSTDSSRVSKEVARGTQSKICVTDWNGDGLLDLLVGDFCMQKPDLPEPTAEEKTEYDRIRKELEPIQERFGELIQKMHGPSRVKTKEEMEKIQKEIAEISKQTTELRSRLPAEYERHGWIWLFMRKKI